MPIGRFWVHIAKAGVRERASLLQLQSKQPIMCPARAAERVPYWPPRLR